MIDEALRSLIINDPRTSVHVAERFYASLMPEGYQLPCATYNQMTESNDQTFDGPGLCTTDYQIDIYSQTRNNSRAIAKAFKSVLDGFRGMVGGYEICRATVTNTIVDYEEDLNEYHAILDVSITHREE